MDRRNKSSRENFRAFPGVVVAASNSRKEPACAHEFRVPCGTPRAAQTCLAAKVGIAALGILESTSLNRTRNRSGKDVLPSERRRLSRCSRATAPDATLIASEPLL